MIINVIDMDDSTTRQPGDSIAVWNNRILTAQGNSTIIRIYGMSNGVAEMVKQVCNAANDNSIDVFRIWGHGSNGNQNVASESGGAVHWSGISVSNFSSISGELARIRSLFKSGARAELRGCSVAGGTDGERLLQLLAALWNVPVYGRALDQRTAHSDWVPPVVCSEPNGSLSSSAGIPVR